MYFFQCMIRLTVLFHVLSMISHVLSASKRQKEQAFSDVLTNITLANKILQDLLKNYERIEKIYQSEELLQSNPLTSENPLSGQSFKSVMSSKQKFKQRDKSHKKHTNSPFKGTVMMYASESVENLSEDTQENIKEVNTYKKPVKSHRNDPKYKKEVNKKVLNTNFLENKKLKENIKGKYKALFNESSSEDIQSDEVEQIIIEIPKDISDADDEEHDRSDVNLVKNTPHKRKIKSYSNKPIENILGEKTRFSIKHTAPNKPNKKSKANISKGSLRTKNNVRRIKKVVYSEKFSPDKIWNDIINKPIKLQKDEEEIFREPYKIKNDKKITVLILTNNKKVNDDYNVETKLPKSNVKDVLSKFNLLNEVLRSEYGETCLQMPIKKCKKALKIANKNICKRRFKCKSDFKSDFIQNSKDGCNKEFAYRDENTNKNIKNNKTKNEINQKFSPPDFRQLQKKSSKNKIERRNIKKHDNFIFLRNGGGWMPKDAFLRFRRRRDKYEKQCQKESTKKCNGACEYAIKETCSVHTCEKRKKKALKGECKNQCKKAYADVRKRVKSSSKSDSDSDTESESDSESD